MQGGPQGPPFPFRVDSRACASIPRRPPALSRTLAGDVAVILSLCLFAWLGLKVHDGIARAGCGRPRDPGLGARDLVLGARRRPARSRARSTAPPGASTGCRSSATTSPSALREAPRGATEPLRGTADEQARRLIAAGPRAGAPDLPARQPRGLADVPDPGAAPARARARRGAIRQIRRMSAAQRALRGRRRSTSSPPARPTTCPTASSARYTRDPFGDLAAGRHAALIAALVDDAGREAALVLRRRRPRPTSTSRSPTTA